MYGWSYDPNYVTITMGTKQEDAQKYKVKLPSRYDQIVFTPSEQEDIEAMEIAYILNEPRQDPIESVDLRHTTHSLKRQLRITWCKKALIGLVVALLLASAVIAVLVVVLGIGTPSPSSSMNFTVSETTVLAYEDCKSNQFTCSSGECIPDRWRCDERVDCLNEADEQLCDNYTSTPPRSCRAWKAEFQINCPPSGCPFYPICTPTGHWDPVQCTADNVSCWCVDWATGATVPGSFVKEVGEAGRPFCEMKPAK